MLVGGGEWSPQVVNIVRGPLCTLDRHKHQFISGNEPASLAATLLRNTGFEMRARILYVYLYSLSLLILACKFILDNFMANLPL